MGVGSNVTIDGVVRGNYASRGGGLCVTESALVSIRSMGRCENNVGDCLLANNGRCPMALGGCAFGDSGRIDVSGGSITGNSALGASGSGGGFGLSGTVNTSVWGGRVEMNWAAGGGGLFVTDDGRMFASRTNFSMNRCNNRLRFLHRRSETVFGSPITKCLQH